MISHQFEERLLGALLLIVGLVMLGSALWLAVLFFKAYAAKNVPDMLLYGFVLTWLASGRTK